MEISSNKTFGCWRGAFNWWQSVDGSTFIPHEPSWKHKWMVYLLKPGNSCLHNLKKKTNGYPLKWQEIWSGIQETNVAFRNTTSGRILSWEVHPNPPLKPLLKPRLLVLLLNHFVETLRCTFAGRSVFEQCFGTLALVLGKAVLF